MLWPLFGRCLFAAEARPKYNSNEAICGGWGSATRSKGCMLGWLCSGGTQMPAMGSSQLTAILSECCGCDRQVPLLLGFCFHPSECAFHSSLMEADGCLQSPRQTDRWALLSSELRARLCWPCLFSWLESVKKTFLCLQFLLPLEANGNQCKS